MGETQNVLVALYLFDWQQNSRFNLTVNLNQLDAEMLALSPPPPDPKVKNTDVIKVSVFSTTDPTVPLANASIGGMDANGNGLLDISDRSQSITIGSLSNLRAGNYNVALSVVRIDFSSGAPVENTFLFNPVTIMVPDPIAVNAPYVVELKSTSFEYHPSKDLWEAIKGARLNFNNMKSFLDDVLCKPITNGLSKYPLNYDQTARDKSKQRLPFVNVDEYSLVKYAVDAYLRKSLRLENTAGNYSLNPLPYYQSLQSSLFEMLDDHFDPGSECEALAMSRRNGFLAIELIWSYWTEQALLVQAMGAINLRYQNIRGQHEIEPMMRFDTSPLLPLSNLIWGSIQDETNRTSLRRRVFEYQHAYNLTLSGKAVPTQIGVDNRSHFLSAFHNLLHQASLFYKEHDDHTRQADAFPLLIALRDVHLLLAEGNHNAYYNMTYTTRHEMLTMQYLLSQPEMQIFLGGRPMMPYEPHVGALDTIKSIQGWDAVGTTHYYELANAGEQILLGIRYGDWNNSMLQAANAGHWAIAFRDLISIYINAYRNVTMVDLSADSMRGNTEERALQPAMLIQRRMALTGPRRPVSARKQLSEIY